ncbi:hypothetical protein [Halorubrum sp. Eb13]|uniref:hypothetical protein n=1 Tax=Halorubrum sp. Eb13 TaxID=1383843 RepID=UPI000B987C72|nr:hypothetical protein [Halorubrum sp. Eb13]OYR41428.1 hypothetical protein DJ75_14060 [Halorubrum sp. Eb13]
MHRETCNEDTLLEKAALFGVALLIIAVAIAIVVPPAERYEISIYGAYPFYFWICLVGAMLVGALVILGSAVQSTGRSWIFGLCLILISNALLLSLPFVRGYYMYFRGDPLSHIGYALDIVNSGEVFGNIYPLTHLLAVTLSTATGWELRTVAMFLPLVLSVLYFGAMFYLLARLFECRQQILLVLPFTMLPVMGRAHTEFRPFGFAVLLLTLVLYLFVASQRTSAIGFRVAFVVTLVSIILYHPLVGIFTIGIFAIWFLSRYIPRVHTSDLTPTNVVSISAVIFFTWYSNFTGIILRFDFVYESIFGLGGGNSPADNYTQTVNEASPPLIDIVRVAVFRLGIEFLLFALGFAFIAAMTYILWKGRSNVGTFIFAFAMALAVFSLGGLAFLLVDLIVPHERPFQIGKIFATILVGRLFYVLLKQIEWPLYESKIRKSVGVILIVTLILLTGLSVSGAHLSPVEAESNHQITEMQFSSAAWMAEHDTTADTYLEASFSYYRYSHALYGLRTGPEDTPSFQRSPDHFNYDVDTFMGSNYTNNHYLLISHRARIFYPEIYPRFQENWRFTPEEFDRLEQDRTVTRTYDNGDQTQYLIEGEIE